METLRHVCKVCDSCVTSSAKHFKGFADLQNANLLPLLHVRSPAVEALCYNKGLSLHTYPQLRCKCTRPALRQAHDR